MFKQGNNTGEEDMGYVMVKEIKDGRWFTGEIYDLEYEDHNFDVFEGVSTRFVMLWCVVDAQSREEAIDKYDQTCDEDLNKLEIE
jgi:hypothetical protein